MQINYTPGIKINVDRNDLLYFTNETIYGTIDAKLARRKTDFAEIYLELVGGGYCSPKIHLGGLHEGKEKLTLRKGKYSWPFQIKLTDHFSSSINPLHIYPSVAYCLRVTFNTTWLHRDIGSFLSITIYPRIDILNNPQISQPIQFKEMGPKDLIIQGSLNKTGYLPGESMHIMYSIENPHQILIKHTNVSLIQISYIHEDQDRCQIFTTTLPNISDFQNKFINNTLSITLPSDLSSPSHPCLDDRQQRNNVKTLYQITFEVKIEDTKCNDFYFNVPFLLGTHSLQNYDG